MHQIISIIAKDFIVIPVAVYGYLFIKIDKAARKRLLVSTVASLVLAVVLIKLAAMLHNDPRPFIRDGVTPYFSHGNDNGFPSDHTVFSALLALLVLTFWQRVGIGLLAVAVAIGTARVIAGVHHGIDILAGLAIALLAYAFGLLAMRTVVHWHAKSTK